jgi:multidrug resistance efflux pump
MNRMAWILTLVAVLIGGGLVGIYGYEGAHYVSAAEAQVVAPAAIVTAPAAGTVTTVDLPVGDRLARGATVARIRTAAGAVTPIRLMLAGSVAADYASAGDSVSAGQELGEVVALGQSTVVAEVTESDAGRVRIGQSVDLVFPDDPSTVSGQVVHIGRAALVTASQSGLPTLTTANATEYVPVTIRFRKGGLRVVDGMSATVRIHV